MTIFHASTFLRRSFFCVALIGFVGIFCAPPVNADPTPSLDQLYVIDQGRQFTIIWHFYYKLLPPKFILREKNSKMVALDDPATLKENLGDIASVAFVLTVDGEPAPLIKIQELTVAPDGGCFATMLYPGHKNGHLELREDLLPYYPSSYVMNYQIYSPLNRLKGVSGYFAGGAPSPVVEYFQLGADAPPSILDWLNSTPVSLFKSGLRTAWINTNWLFMAIVLALMRPAREVLTLGLIMAAGWFLPCFFWVLDGLQVPVTIHPVIPGLITILICFLLLRRVEKFLWLAVSIAGASLLNGCFDIQQTSLERPAADPANLAGLNLGFIAGLALVFGIGLALVSECRKYPGFHTSWAPKICWGLAALALVLPWVRT